MLFWLSDFIELPSLTHLQTFILNWNSSLLEAIENYRKYFLLSVYGKWLGERNFVVNGYRGFDYEIQTQLYLFDKLKGTYGGSVSSSQSVVRSFRSLAVWSGDNWFWPFLLFLQTSRATPFPHQLVAVHPFIAKEIEQIKRKLLVSEGTKSDWWIKSFYKHQSLSHLDCK